MSQEIADMPGVEAAMERFAEFEESKPAAEATAATAQATRDPKPADAQPTADPSKAQNSDSPTPPDTRAAAEQAKPAPTTAEQITEQAKPDASKPADAAKTETDKSRYAKSQERLTKTWDQVNAEKTALQTEKAKLETERADFARQRAEFDTIRKQAEQPQFKPEDYQAASRQKKQLADHQRAEAKRFEDAGKFAEAEKLTKQAAKNDALSEDMAEAAENLRRNPPQGFAQRQQQYEQAKQAWTLEAAKAFPELVKENSEFQKTVAEHLNALAKNEPQLLAQPSVIYHVSRLVAAETQVKALATEAARVPVLMKETESLRAKIKELEALTTPAGGGGVARVGAEAPDDYNTLRQAAAESGSLFR